MDNSNLSTRQTILFWLGASFLALDVVGAAAAVFSGPAGYTASSHIQLLNSYTSFDGTARVGLEAGEKEAAYRCIEGSSDGWTDSEKTILAKIAACTAMYRLSLISNPANAKKMGAAWEERVTTPAQLTAKKQAEEDAVAKAKLLAAAADAETAKIRADLEAKEALKSAVKEAVREAIPAQASTPASSGFEVKSAAPAEAAPAPVAAPINITATVTATPPVSFFNSTMVVSAAGVVADDYVAEAKTVNAQERAIIAAKMDTINDIGTGKAKLSDPQTINPHDPAFDSNDETVYRAALVRKIRAIATSHLHNHPASWDAFAGRYGEGKQALKKR